MPHRENRALAGILFFITGNLLTAIVDAVAKSMTSDVHVLQITWGYFTTMAVLVGGYVVVARLPRARFMDTKLVGLHLARAALLVTTVSALFTGLAYIPLADAVAIMFSAPLFITALSVPFLGERVGVHRWSAVVIGLAGVIVIVQPGGAMEWPVLMPLAAALSFAAFQILTRRLMVSEPPLVALFYISTGACLWSSLIVVFIWSPLTVEQIGMFAGIGLLGVFAHLCIIKAFQAAQASFLAPFNYVKLVWAAVLGYLMFGDIPDNRVLIGSAVIIATGLYLLWRERRPVDTKERAS
jgi:drug/metabolite transporter (DMT)-like permease